MTEVNFTVKSPYDIGDVIIARCLLTGDGDKVYIIGVITDIITRPNIIEPFRANLYYLIKTKNDNGCPETKVEVGYDEIVRKYNPYAIKDLIDDALSEITEEERHNLESVEV